MGRRVAIGMAALALGIGCSRSEEPRTRTTAEASRWADALLDSAGVAASRGDTTGARSMLARAAALGAASPTITYRVGRALERAGDVGQAARAYRRYLALTPSGAEADWVRTHLEEIVAGGVASTRVATGAVAPQTPAVGLSDPSLGTPSAPSASSATPPAAPAPRRAERAARPRARAPRQVAVTPTPAAPPRTAAPDPTPPAPRIATTPAPAVAPPATVIAESTVVVSDGEPAPTAEDSTLATKRVHFSRWSRMQSWFVAKIAGLGGAGGAVVGAIIGNVPGAIALGTAGGAAGGLAKVHADKVDSARAIKAAMAAVAHRDSAAGEVAPPR